jgi:hypothetical protein
MPSTIDHDLNRLARRAQELTKRFPETRVLFDIAATANEMPIARLDTSTAREARPLIDAATTILKGLRGSRDHLPVEHTAVDANAEQALISTERAGTIPRIGMTSSSPMRIRFLGKSLRASRQTDGSPKQITEQVRG